MFRLYSSEKARIIIFRNSNLIAKICDSCKIPEAYLKSILMMEIPNIDLFDYFADAVVRMNWLRYSLIHTYHPEQHTNNPFRKYDSSTGYCQIFSHVAIKAVDFAREKGMLGKDIFPDILSDESPDCLRSVWLRLKRDKAFNMTCCALNLMFCAYQMTGKIDFSDYSDNDKKLIFSRYNGNVKRITAYGEKAFLYYLEFCT